MCALNLSCVYVHALLTVMLVAHNYWPDMGYMCVCVCACACLTAVRSSVKAVCLCDTLLNVHVCEWLTDRQEFSHQLRHNLGYDVRLSDERTHTPQRGVHPAPAGLTQAASGVREGQQQVGCHTCHTHTHTHIHAHTHVGRTAGQTHTFSSSAFPCMF